MCGCVYVCSCVWLCVAVCVFSTVVALGFAVQDFLQVLSMFAGFGFQWPSIILSVYNALSLLNFNFELLAPECSVSLNFEQKWYVIQSLPLILLTSIGLVMLVTRVVQLVQQHVFHTLPFGALSKFSLVDSCIGIFVSGVFMLYFGKAGILMRCPC